MKKRLESILILMMLIFLRIETVIYHRSSSPVIKRRIKYDKNAAGHWVYSFASGTFTHKHLINFKGYLANLDILGHHLTAPWGVPGILGFSLYRSHINGRHAKNRRETGQYHQRRDGRSQHAQICRLLLEYRRGQIRCDRFRQGGYPAARRYLPGLLA